VEGVYIQCVLDVEPVQRSEDGCDKRRFRSFNHSTCKTVLNVLEAVYLRFRKIVVERVTVVEFLERTIEAVMVLAVLESYLLTYFTYSTTETSYREQSVRYWR